MKHDYSVDILITFLPFQVYVIELPLMHYLDRHHRLINYSLDQEYSYGLVMIAFPLRLQFVDLDDVLQIVVVVRLPLQQVSDCMDY